MRAKTKGETYKRKTGTPRICPRRSIVSSPLGDVLFLDVRSQKRELVINFVIS